MLDPLLLQQLVPRHTVPTMERSTLLDEARGAPLCVELVPVLSPLCWHCILGHAPNSKSSPLLVVMLALAQHTPSVPHSTLFTNSLRLTFTLHPHSLSAYISSSPSPHTFISSSHLTLTLHFSLYLVTLTLLTLTLTFPPRSHPPCHTG